MCAHTPESQSYLKLHKQKHSQQAEGGDAAPLPVRPHLEFCVQLSAQERHGAVGVGPEEGHKNDQRGGIPLLQAQAERVGVVQPGEEKGPERSCCSLSVLKGVL